MLEEDEFSDGELDEENEMVPQLCILWGPACYILVGFILQQLQQFSAEYGGISKKRDVSLTKIWSMNFFSLVVMIIGGRLPTRISIFGIHSIGTEL